jgi:hypothetical protein
MRCSRMMSSRLLMEYGQARRRDLFEGRFLENIAGQSMRWAASGGLKTSGDQR